LRPAVDPSPVLGLITGYWNSMALFAATDVGVFTALASGPKRAPALAAELGVSERPLRMLLGAMAGLGLLEARDEEFSNTALANAFLVEGRPGSLVDGIRYAADTYRLWGVLPDVVRTGVAPADAQTYLGDDPARTRRFVWGMHSRAMGVARSLVRFIDLAPGTRLLDLGGGPGTYSLLLAQNVPGLSAIVFDLPPIVSVAREIIDSFGLADRVQVHAGDFTRDAYPSGMTAALVSGVLHREPEATCRAILTRLHAALEPGATIVLADVMLDADRAHPVFSALFALNMLVTSERGGAHSKDEQGRWLEDAGFVDVKVRELPPPAVHTVITARTVR
jgi:3-hydroxy-5-methyl-1-naphthoate 3-O-methyltransferase